MDRKQLKTREEVVADFERKGISVSSWAKKHKIPRSIVYGILNGTRKARIGLGHKAAVLLGIKDGEIVEEEGHEHA